MTVYATVHPNQGVKAMPGGSQIGGVTFFTGAGIPATILPYANRIGDVYIDYTNGNMYIATATGTGSWQQYTAATATLASATTIGGTSVFTVAGSPASVTTAARIGDLAIDYTNGQLYVASATGTGGWVSTGGNVASALKSASTIGGSRITTGNGTPTATASVPNRIGDIYIDYAVGKMYVAGGVSAASDYKIVTSA